MLNDMEKMVIGTQIIKALEECDTQETIYGGEDTDYEDERYAEGFLHGFGTLETIVEVLCVKGGLIENSLTELSGDG